MLTLIHCLHLTTKANTMNKVTVVSLVFFFCVKVAMVINDCAQIDKSNQRMSEYKQQMSRSYND